jgi:hypothetical protein
MGDYLPVVFLGTYNGNNVTASAVAAGNAMTCIIAAAPQGGVKCFGNGQYGALGQGSTANAGNAANTMGDFLPFINLGTNLFAVSIFTSGYSVCALLNVNQLKCWGLGNAGQLFNGNLINAGSGPSQMGDYLPLVSLTSANQNVTFVSISSTACASLASGEMLCWGLYSDGKTGLPSYSLNMGSLAITQTNPLPFMEFASASMSILSVGLESTCASNGSYTMCFGNGQVNGQESTTASPTCMGQSPLTYPGLDLGTLLEVVQVAVGGNSACALFADGSMKCWGTGGQLGTEDTVAWGQVGGYPVSSAPFVQVGTGLSVAAMAVGFQSVCVLLESNGIKCASW